MDNEQQSYLEQRSDNQPAAEQIIYPQKPEPEEKKGNVWVRSLSSLVLYLAVGYYFFQGNLVLLLILTSIVIFHELGHFVAMKIYNYKDLGIFFIPLLGAYASGTKKEVSQKQSAVILLAGPLPGIIVGLALYIFNNSHDVGSIHDMNIVSWASIFLIVLNVLNLLPIYPLDGGQLLNRLFLDESRIISRIFVLLSALGLAYFAIKLGEGNRTFYLLLIFPLMMLFRLRTDSKFEKLTKQVEDRGINLEKTYGEITDEEYWKIRNILIENNYPTVRHLAPAPPYEYSSSEDKVVATIEGLLQRTIIQDLNWAGKILIIVIWAAAFASPFLIELQFPFFRF
jgi:stage IV sporulation protein FB